jgi:signal transduction histidine kinase
MQTRQGQMRLWPRLSGETKRLRLRRLGLLVSPHTIARRQNCQDIALEQFAYIASHDLQEPLRTMGAFAELLTKKYKSQLDGEANKFLSFIMSAANRMSALVKELLAYARLTTEEAARCSIAIDEDLETALTDLSQLITESGGYHSRSSADRASRPQPDRPVVPEPDWQCVEVPQDRRGCQNPYRR